MASKTITITKVGDEKAPPSVKKEEVPIVASSRKKSTKTFPRSILKKTSKIVGVRDPAKSGILKKGMRSHTLRLMTDKGLRKHRKTLKHKISKMSDSKVKDIIQKAGLVTNPSTPPNIARQILDSAAGAGFVSV
jgi:hypothetical protein